MQVSKHQPRHRSQSSDPFNDPANISYSSYGVPTLARNAPLASVPRQHQPPPPPPKLVAKHRYPPPAGNRENIMDAVRDTVTVRGSTDQSPRTRMGRSQTELPPPSNLRPAQPPVSRRSHSQDSVARAAANMEKAKQPSRPRPKKGSSHADVIDRLDFSGVGPMFHHDGPFDACAPSRNRHRSKAPMLAWSAATEADREALANAREIQPRGQEGPYPSPDIYVPYEAPKKKHDAIAEAWGIHEPEPFEDFSAGGGVTSRPSGEYPRSNGNGTTRRTKDGRDARDVYREYLDEHHPSPARRQPTTKRTLPPPQPIFVPESDYDNNPPSPTSAGAPGSPGANGTPRRNKSIMQRIRKMRDAPNVPVGHYDDEDARGRETSPGSAGKKHYTARGSLSQPPPPARPTHRSQASFPGRYAYVYVDHVPMKKEKSLPTPPPKDGYTPMEGGNGYFDPDHSTGSAGGGGGLGRKTSLLKKVREVVKGK
ncbi:hypothetical protein PYCCODRAFT_1444569 [Trametes coccinea BRFM310]|uniref:Pal1-domain-containing protein n=1 Tax=Trametes coccinea (strain BRFM310) TaxID=1353009 RepID=A0A1Y2IPW9_TRAC3|nr:hypothetical protein PYCCODRAFT_1444569 [Trametes coccinea BRFM310]